MKSIRMAAISMTMLMLFGILTSLGSLVVEEQKQPEELVDEIVVREVSSPGHPVFSQYITSDNCGYCYAYGSPAHDSIKQQHPDDYVYISYQSVSYGDTDTARAGNTNGYNWPWTASGAPDSYWGDRLDKRVSGCGSNTCYDSMFSSGGGMSAATTSQYALSAAVSDGGSNLDVTIDVQYLGTGTAPTNMFVYAAMTEKTCNSYVYADGSKGHNCWKAWLMGGSTYRSQSGGSGNGFQSVSLSNNAASYTWSVPKNLVNGGSGNALVVAALMTGAPSTGASSEHVLTATDSDMAPLIDVGVQSFTAQNDDVAAVNGGYINGDLMNLEATIVNNGVDAYSDGGDVRFYYKIGSSKQYVGATNQLSSLSPGSTQTFSGQIDTTSFSQGAYQSTFGVEISNLLGDKNSNNNDGREIIPHDLVPSVRKAQVIGNTNIERGDNFLIEAKTTINDGVDINTSFYTFDVEISPSGMNQWMGDENLIVGGDQVFQEGTNNEHRQYLVKPTMSMGAGKYDIRIRAIDSRMQVSDWDVNSEAFTLKNALPTITSEPVPTVKVQTSTKVSVIGNIMDAETDLRDLDITSSSPDFIAWHPVTEEVEVYFENIRYVNGNPTPSGIEVAVDDGTDVAYGTLLFNVIENGQPRWAGVEKQYIDEGSTASLALLSYLSDTNSQGEYEDPENLLLAIIDNSNPDLLDIELDDFTLNYATKDDDINGETTITVRASDGDQYSDQLITIVINPINDAPRLDLSEYDGLRLKAGEQKVIFLNEIATDIDSDLSEAIFTASNPVPGAARVRMMDNTLTLLWDEAGLQTVTIQAADRYDSNTYTLVVDVYDSVPLIVGGGDAADVQVNVQNIFIGEQPEATMFLNMDDVTITSLSTTWQYCNEVTGICLFQNAVDHDITMKNSGWTYNPYGDQLPYGLQFKDQVKLVKVVAIDSTGEKYEYSTPPIYWTVTENAPGPESMDEQELEEYIEELELAIADKKAEIQNLDDGTDEYNTAKEELVQLENDLDEACGFGECTQNQQAGTPSEGTDTSSGMTLTVILIIVGVVIASLLAGLMFMRSGNNSSNSYEGMVDWANQLPANDVVANSMYGGAQEIFQQTIPVAAPVVVQQVPPGAPPLPEGGLPAGWTMEQWAYYGHQYLQGQQ